MPRGGRTSREAKLARCCSLLVVERGMASGYERGRNLEKIGQHAQDTVQSCSSTGLACRCRESAWARRGKASATLVRAAP